MNHSSYGAVVHGRQADAVSTVEARTLGGARAIALIAVHGELTRSYVISSAEHHDQGVGPLEVAPRGSDQESYP